MSPVAASGDLSIVYETHGDPAAPALLLVSGYTRQLIGWPVEFVDALVAGGRFVIVYDNRDCGLSSKLTDRTVDLSVLMAAAGGGDWAGAREIAAYTLSEMAADGIAVLDALGIDRAHVLGVSMGGMIAQTMTIEHPDRVLSLVSIMSRTGEPGYGDPTPEAAQVIMSPPATNREQAVAGADRTAVWRSNRWPELERERDLIGRAWDRDHTPGNQTRQFGAMMASGSRDAGLRHLDVPTLVIHGLDDQLIAPSGGEHTAELIPGAQLMLVEDMGHDLPLALIPEISAAVLAHTA